MSWLKLPNKAKPGQPVKAEDFNLLRAALRQVAVLPGTGYLLKRTEGGTMLAIPRGKGGGGNTPAKVCPFGEIISLPAGKAIRGGIVYAGDKVWNVDQQAINLALSGDYLAWLEVGVTANSEDGLPLPNLLTSTAPTWENGPLSGGYPDMTQPTGASPTGTAIIPIGAYSVTAGSLTFAPVACGDVRIGYCPTNLSVDRINTIIVESFF